MRSRQTQWRCGLTRLLAAMWLLRGSRAHVTSPAARVQYMSEYLGGVNADGAMRMSHLAAELADANATIRRLEETVRHISTPRVHKLVPHAGTQ